MQIANRQAKHAIHQYQQHMHANVTELPFAQAMAL
jgi:hypothetical protein